MEHSAFLAMEPPTVTHNDLRAVTRDGRPAIVKSDRLREAEGALVARLARLAPGEPMGGPLSVEVRWCFATRGAHAQGEPHTCRPDMSNMLKTLEDCMRRAGWIVDDSLICDERTAKAWMDPAGIWVRVASLA